MSERLEYFGNPLPVGLPGFGGGTINILILPGFNRVVAAQKFGPVNDAPTIIPPDPVAPPGSNPEDPTNEVVPPAQAPAAPSSPTKNFCKQCESQNNVGQSPLMYGVRSTDSCVNCSGQRQNVTRYFSELTAASSNNGVFYTDTAEITGKLSGNIWKLNPTKLQVLNGSSSAELIVDEVAFSNGGDITVYATGPKITGTDGKVYEPRSLEVCVGGSSQTWKVLAATS
jgi:hypothetical protein